MMDDHLSESEPTTLERAVVHWAHVRNTHPQHGIADAEAVLLLEAKEIRKRFTDAGWTYHEGVFSDGLAGD